MGSVIEINDTLQISLEQGFPATLLDLKSHIQQPVSAESLKDHVFRFHGKPGVRFFQTAPVRVYWVQNIEGKWLFWGKIIVIEQTISQLLVDGESWKEGDWQTSGKYSILEIFDPAYQELFTRRESPAGKSFFG